jgi:hypothetical protein
MVTIQKIDGLDTSDCVLYYGASNYLADLLKTKGRGPLLRVDLSGSFHSLEDQETDMVAEIKNSLNTLLDAIDEKKVK